MDVRRYFYTTVYIYMSLVAYFSKCTVHWPAPEGAGSSCGPCTSQSPGAPCRWYQSVRGHFYSS